MTQSCGTTRHRHTCFSVSSPPTKPYQYTTQNEEVGGKLTSGGFQQVRHAGLVQKSPVDCAL